MKLAAAARELVRLGDAGRSAAALKAADRLVAAAPALGWARFYRAGLLLAAGRPADAAADLAMLACLAPEALFEAGREAELPPASASAAARRALPLVRAALRARAARAWAFVLEAYALRHRRDWTGAARAMERALAAAPRDPAVAALAARVLYTTRLGSRARALLARAQRAAPRCFWIAAWRCEALRHCGDLRGARRLLDEALRREPGYDIARSWRGGVRRALGDAAGAQADLSAAIRREWEGDADSASLAWAYHERSLARRALGRHGAAFRDLRAAHRLNSRYGYVSDGRGAAPSPERSLQELERLASHGPARAQALAWLGLALAVRGRSLEAVRALDAALRRAPKDAWARAWRAGAALDAGAAPAHARRELGLSLRRDPDYALARLLRGKLLLKEGRALAAEKDLARAVALDPFHAGAWAARAEAAKRLGRRKQARAFLRRAREIDPRGR